DINQPNRKTLREYRKAINRINSSLIKIENSCCEIRRFLFYLKRLQQWCETNLIYLQVCSQSIKNRLSIQVKNNEVPLIEVDFNERLKNLIVNIASDKVTLNERTISAYEELGGFERKIGGENTILFQRLDELKTLSKNLSKIENSFEG